MSDKREVYYKFIFPKYSSLSVSPKGDSFIPDSDGIDQRGEVRALCNVCPENVITYDQLSSDAVVEGPSKWRDSTAWSDEKKSEIKYYVDHYAYHVPKYFNLRNYWDANICQEGGMSLCVLHSPEIGCTSTRWTRFDSDYNDNHKVVYYSLVVSSGDFYYEWNLPENVLVKSGIRDEVVSSKFHSNWYINQTRGFEDATGINTTEQVGYWYYYSCSVGKQMNAVPGSEKIVFTQPYFFDEKVVDKGKKWEDVKDIDGKPYVGRVGHTGDVDTIVNLHTSETDDCFTNPNNIEYKAAYGDTSPELDSDGNPTGRTKGEAAIASVVASDTRCLEKQNLYIGNSNYWSPGDTLSLPWNRRGGSNRTKYSEIKEDLKTDFIDLEVTRRILHYGEYDYSATLLADYTDSITGTKVHNQIPRIVSGSGKSTVLAYDRPQEYIDRPPTPIRYDLLRYSLNDRPPFSDCETVLVMWVANGDPDAISDDDPDKLQKLHDLEWEQYAIPISVRCCFKGSASNKYCTDRFLVSYPYRWNTDTSVGEQGVGVVAPTYRFHIRRGEAYNSYEVDDNIKFKEALYLRDLIDYSSDYVIVFQNKNYIKGFDIQWYLFNNYPNAFKKLYVKKTYNNANGNNALSMNQQQQIYYIRVNEIDSNNDAVFNVKTDDYSSSDRKICIRDKHDATQPFVPSDVITRLDNTGEVQIVDQRRSWDFDDVTYHDTHGYNDWRIDDSCFITLFDAKYTVDDDNVFKKITAAIISITDGTVLYNFLRSVTTAYGTWEDIYISSLGISPTNQTNTDSLLHGGTGGMYFSLGLLDNHIALNGTQYGSNYHKVIVGFDNMFDFKYEDAYHFKYDGTNYNPVKTWYSYNSATGECTPEQSSASYTCTAYYVDYD